MKLRLVSSSKHSPATGQQQTNLLQDLSCTPTFPADFLDGTPDRLEASPCQAGVKASLIDANYRQQISDRLARYNA